VADTDLTYQDFVCRREDRKLWLDLIPGVWAPTSVRGGDEIIVGMPGRLQIDRVPDRMVVNMVGWAVGQGDTMTERWQDIHDTLVDFRDTFVIGETGTIEVTPPYLGVQTNSVGLQVRVVNLIYGEHLSTPFVRIDVEFECVQSPPAWFEIGG
jgi:hypothetical protein